jgi:hypothetical protein
MGWRVTRHVDELYTARHVEPLGFRCRIRQIRQVVGCSYLDSDVFRSCLDESSRSRPEWRAVRRDRHMPHRVIVSNSSAQRDLELGRSSLTDVRWCG